MRKADKLLQIVLHAEPGSVRFLLRPCREWQQIRGYTAATQDSTTERLFRFIEFSEERGIARPEEVSRQVVERFQRHLYARRQANGKPLGIKYQAQVLAALQGFFKWLTRERHILYNPTSEMLMPKLPQTLPRAILSTEEVESILAGVDATTPFGMRDRALLEILYSTGMRRMEIARLLVYDLDLAMGTVFIRQGKGSKDRMVPVGERALTWARKYLEDVRPNLVSVQGADHLFLSAQGGPMNLEYVGNLVMRYVKQSGIGKLGGCHLFRHTCATLMLDNGADVRFVQALLGHANLNTTQIYTQVSIQKLKEIHKATHPAKLKAAEPSSP